MNGYVAMAHVALPIILTVVWYWVINLLTRTVDDQKELLSGNWAYFSQRAGMVLGPVIGTIPMVIRGLDNWGSLGLIAYAFAWAALWGSLGHWIVDWFFLWKKTTPFDALCVPIGIAKGGFALGMGILTFGLFIGEAPSPLVGFLSLLLFTIAGVAGQIIVLMVFSLLIYGFRAVKEAIGDSLEPQKVRQSLRQSILDSNPAGGLYALGALLLTSILLAGAVAGDFTTWGDSFKGLGVAFGLALVGALVSALVVDATILTGRGMTLWGVLHNRKMAPAALLALFMTVCAIPAALVVNQWVA